MSTAYYRVHQFTVSSKIQCPHLLLICTCSSFLCRHADAVLCFALRSPSFFSKESPKVYPWKMTSWWSEKFIDDENQVRRNLKWQKNIVKKVVIAKQTYAAMFILNSTKYTECKYSTYKKISTLLNTSTQVLNTYP